jgi:uncharacterized protein
MTKIIISDTSCLIALSKIGMLNILKDLYREIIITREVNDEFADKLPEWIIVLKLKTNKSNLKFRNDWIKVKQVRLPLP